MIIMCPMKVLPLTKTVDNRGYLVGVRSSARCGDFGEERVAITVGATSHFLL